MENDDDQGQQNPSRGETPIERAQVSTPAGGTPNKSFDKALKYTILAYCFIALIIVSGGSSAMFNYILGLPLYAVPTLLAIIIIWSVYCKLTHRKSENVVPILGGIILGLIGGVVLGLLILLGACFLGALHF